MKNQQGVSIALRWPGHQSQLLILFFIGGLQQLFGK